MVVVVTGTQPDQTSNVHNPPTHIHTSFFMVVVDDQVYWNDKKIGKTVHIDDTLDPVWDLEIFSVRIDQDGPNSIEESTLRIVCVDWDQFGSDDVLGQIELAGSQIKQLAESKDGDEVVSDNEGAMAEADMEKIFDFVRLLQEHEMDEAGLGKMMVGVPQDPIILRGKDLEQASEAVEEVEPSKKKRRNKKRRKHGGAEESTQRETHGEGGGAKKEPNSSEAKPPETLGSDADPARNSVNELMPGRDKTEAGAGSQAEPVHESQATGNSVEGANHEGRAGDARGQAEDGGHQGEGGDATAVAIEEGGRPIDQARVSVVGMGLRSDGNKGGVDLPTRREGQEQTPGAIRASADILNVDALGTKVGDAVSNQALFLEEPPAGEKTLELGPGKDEKLGQKLTPDAVQPAMTPVAGVTEGSSEGNAADAGPKLSSSHALETGATKDTTGDQALSDARDEGVNTAKSSDTEGQLEREADDVEAGVAQDGSTTAGAGLDDSKVNAVETEGKATAGDQTLLSEAPGKGKNTAESILEKEEHSVQDIAPTDDDVPTALHTADVKNGDGRPKKSSAAASPRTKRDRKTTVQNANALCYRDGKFVLPRVLGSPASLW